MSNSFPNTNSGQAAAGKVPHRTRRALRTMRQALGCTWQTFSCAYLAALCLIHPLGCYLKKAGHRAYLIALCPTHHAALAAKRSMRCVCLAILCSAHLSAQTPATTADSLSVALHDTVTTNSLPPPDVVPQPHPTATETATPDPAPLTTLALPANAIATRATTYGLGRTNVYDTYLSPQEYIGIEGRVAHEVLRSVNWFQKKKRKTRTTRQGNSPDNEPNARGNGGRNGSQSPTQLFAPSTLQPSCPPLPSCSSLWIRQSLFEGNVGYTHNRADNNNTLSALVHWTYALMHPWHPAQGLSLLAGPALDLNGGFVYNMRNGNNPAQARAYLNLCATGMAVYQTRLLNRRISLRYQFTLPLLGLMFSPHYGQSYYEIFSVGNASGVVNFTSLHNQPAARQILSADLPLRRITLRLAYVCDIQQSHLHQIYTHTYSHIFMIGFVRQLYLIPPRR